jgi:hypothetical protein
VNDVQTHLAKMLRIVGIEKITARNTEKVWVRIRMWEAAVQCSRWDPDADAELLTTVKEVRENAGVTAAAGTKKLTQFDRLLAHNVRVTAEKAYASLAALPSKRELS